MQLTRPAIVTAILLGLVFVFGLWILGNYNSLVQNKAKVDNAWAQVEVQYQRRMDLIDNVVSSVKGGQKQEREVFGKIADARKIYNNPSSSTSEKAAAASSIETNVALIPRLQEAYPDLKSNTQVTQLMNQLTGTEDGIAKARTAFNDTATNYNIGIQRFPTNIFAGMFGYTKVSLFKADTGASKAPNVSF